ncbi:GspH/FimT family pseudopilin [Marinobacter sp. BGYM27]|uniref:GspH/FimT family pseudopilin n=1 Tax=unclassified Marinobacter TaxID=83889 RepID=UPI0021A7D75F|nr:GspH/FimT family pseudopilin [Marinobacter sp. BGYM27]MDG5500672.1 GspH/FimT family pseudopilin [Marinobacter sp. BGYM27]
MKSTPRHSGFTLAELIITLLIVSILIFIATPSVSALIDDAQRKSAVHDILNVMATARQQAIMSQQILTLCPINSSNTCGKDWNSNLSLFVDPDNQRKLTPTTRIVRTLPPPETGSLRVRSLSKSYFQYRPNGRILSDLGNITWCPDSNDERKAAHLIISRGGRIRIAGDADSDGIPEGANGANIICQ